ncbi:MAG: hypothetical protein ACTSSP_02785 [Candidatus Asgardarchaeia archaeon]
MSKEIKKGKENMNKSKSKKTISKKQNKKVVKTTKIKDLEGKFIHIRVGTSADPASPEQIKEIQDKFIVFLKENNVDCLAFVTHHAVCMEIVNL